MLRNFPVAKIITAALVLAMLASFVLVLPSCGSGNSGTATTAATNAVTTLPPTTTVPPTTAEPTTPAPTTAVPTDPAVRPDPDALGIVEGYRYYIRSRNSNLYLTVDGAFKYAGFSQEEWVGDSTQMFVFEYVSTDDKGHAYYKIQCCGGMANSYIDISDGSTDDGGQLECTVDPYTDQSQLWQVKLASVSKGYYAFMSGSSNFTKAMDVNGVSFDPGALVQQWAGGSQTNQTWYLDLAADWQGAPETLTAAS